MLRLWANTYPKMLFGVHVEGLIYMKWLFFIHIDRVMLRKSGFLYMLREVKAGRFCRGGVLKMAESVLKTQENVPKMAKSVPETYESVLFLRCGWLLISVAKRFHQAVVIGIFQIMII